MKNNPQNKWLLVSCLQKSVRKGFTDLVENYAEELFEIDRSYLSYRLSIIALEDIGIANIPLVKDFLKTEIKKANINELGGKNYVVNIAKELSNSVKDRSACDLIGISTMYGEKHYDNYEQIFLDDSQTLVRRVLAAWEILGAKKMKNPLIQNQQDNIDYFINLNSSITEDKDILDIMRISYKIHNEPHFISLGLLKSLYDKELKSGEKIGKYHIGDFIAKEHPKILIQGKWLLDGIDWHTKEGKAAIYLTIKENTELVRYLKQFIIDSESIAASFGMLLFKKLGQQVNKRLIYKNAIAIFKSAEEITLKKMLHNENVDFVLADKLMNEAIPILKENIEKQFRLANPTYFPF